MIVAIDAGNSRTKWEVFDESGELRAAGVIPNYEIAVSEIPAAWKTCWRSIVSNVAGEEVGQNIARLLKSGKIPVRWAKATAEACGVINDYEKPEQLGADRWAAVIAAWHHYHVPCVVANAGTALTVDAVGKGPEGKGRFLGGIIVPGLGLMQESLAKGAANLKKLEGSLQRFPTNTGDAIYTGALSAMAGAVNSMLVKLQHHADQAPRCIVTGGNANELAEMLERYEVDKLVIADNLVLQGLMLMEKQMGKAE